jgi:hypothetical protein
MPAGAVARPILTPIVGRWDDGGGGHILPREGCLLTCAAMRGKYGAFRSAELPLTSERALYGAFRVSGVALGLC